MDGGASEEDLEENTTLEKEICIVKIVNMVYINMYSVIFGTICNSNDLFIESQCLL